MARALAYTSGLCAIAIFPLIRASTIFEPILTKPARQGLRRCVLCATAHNLCPAAARGLLLGRQYWLWLWLRRGPGGDGGGGVWFLFHAVTQPIYVFGAIFI